MGKCPKNKNILKSNKIRNIPFLYLFSGRFLFTVPNVSKLGAARNSS